MKKNLFIIIVLLFLVPTTQAFTFLNIFIDEKGDAIFLGETDENPVLIEGVLLDNGEISGLTSQLTTKQGDIWTFSYSLQGAEITLVLPEGAVVKELSTGEISLDSNRIAILFQDAITVKYSIVEVQKPIIPSKNIPLVLVLLAILIILIVFLINYAKREKKEEKQKELTKKKDRLEIIKQVLSEREKLIIDKLKETGKIKSSYLRKMVDIPKASFSRHIQELEKKGIIRRIGEGKNKFVELEQK